MKKIFLPVDDSVHSVNALKYSVMMAPVIEDVTYSLFHVQPVVSEYIMKEARDDPEAMKKLKQLNKKNEALGNDILNRHKERLLRRNVAEEKITLATRPRQQGVAIDIIRRATEESADAIALGRRGYSRFQETFIGSTTKNVIDHNAEIPIWVVDGEISSRNILLAVDGSTNSVRAIDHLTDVMRKNPDVDLTIFHVQPSLKDTCGIDFTEADDSGDNEAVTKIIENADRKCVDNFMQYARSKLREKSFDENRLNLKTRPVKLNIAKAIVDEFENGDYGTLVVGKRGINKRFFMGSVSGYLVSHVTNAALWMVP